MINLIGWYYTGFDVLAPFKVLLIEKYLLTVKKS